MAVGLIALFTGLFFEAPDESVGFLALRIGLILMGGLSFTLHALPLLASIRTHRQNESKTIGMQNVIEEGDSLLVDLNEVEVEPTNAPEGREAGDWSRIRYCDLSTGEARWFTSEALPYSVADLQQKLKRWGHTHIHFDRRNPELYLFDLGFLQQNPSVH